LIRSIFGGRTWIRYFGRFRYSCCFLR
jgi:hypothetical protein